MGLNPFKRGGNAGGAERGSAPAGAGTFAAQQNFIDAGKLGLHGTDNVKHDPLESTVGVLATMCGRDVARLGIMLDQQFGEKPEDPVRVQQKAEVLRRVKAAWGIVDEPSGAENSGDFEDPHRRIFRMSREEVVATGDPDALEIWRAARDGDDD